MTQYHPAEIADADQHFAHVTAGLNQLLEAYTTLGDIDRAEKLDRTLLFLTDPHHFQGQRLTHEEHIGTLANLLSVAVDRLASAAKPDDG